MNPEYAGFMLPPDAKRDWDKWMKDTDSHSAGESTEPATIEQPIPAPIKPTVYICTACGSGWDRNTPCPCWTAGIQQTMNFDPPEEPEYAKYEDFLTFKDLLGTGVGNNAPVGPIDSFIKELANEMMAMMAKTMVELPPTPPTPPTPPLSTSLPPSCLFDDPQCNSYTVKNIYPLPSYERRKYLTPSARVA